MAMLIAVGCTPAADPPGRTASSLKSSHALHLTLPVPGADSPASVDGAPAKPSLQRDDTEPGGGEKLAAVAMHAWIYMQPSFKSTKLGYLRAGAVVERGSVPAPQEPSKSRSRCSGGFYRIHPRGWVCVGKTASLDTHHDVTRATPRGPRRGEPFPYDYVVSRTPPPHRYVKLPSPAEQLHVEGVRHAKQSPYWARRNAKILGEAEPITSFLRSGRDTPKPYGAEERVRFASHRGRAKPKSAFGLSATFESNNRRFGMTSELDLIPIDRTRVVRLSSLRGIEIDAREHGTPAFVIHHGVGLLRRGDDGELRPAGLADRRSGWLLTGRTEGTGGRLVETTKGVWLPRGALRVAKLRKDFWGYADGGRAWIDISIDRQLLVAYEGERPVYAALVSTGRGGTEDPDETSATVQGTFFIEHKHITDTMDGETGSDADFDLRDVPYVQYFHHGYALHGAYWHDEFGKPRSNGCVNLSPTDAAWLFKWTDPPVPEGWHGVTNRKRGTLVYIHP